MRKSLLFFFATLLLFASSLKGQSQGQPLYWVGGNGDWDDASNWSSTSGGQGGAGTPDQGTDVIIDGNSFSASGQSIHVTGSSACKDLRFEADGQINAGIEGPSHTELLIHGDMELSGAEEVRTGSIRFVGSGNNEIRALGVQFDGNLVFDGSGSWNVTEELHLGKKDSLILRKGELRIEGERLLTPSFISKGPHERKVLLGGQSHLEVSDRFELSDRSSFQIRSNGGRVLLDPSIQLQNLQLGERDWLESVGRASCFDPGCINQVDIVPQDTAAKNGYDISCKDSCDGKFIGRITDSTNCSSDATFSYNWTISGPYTQTDSLVEGICDQSFIELEIINDSSGQACDVSYSLDVPFTLKRDGVIKTSPSCHDSCDGEVEYYPKDGVSPYDYQWENGDTTFTADSLCVGDHGIVVTDDNGCELDDTVEITQPPEIITGLQTTDASCFGVCDGNAKVDPSGGNGGPYDYMWSTGSTSDSISGLCAGNYSVTVYDQDSCTKTVSFTIGEPAQLQISLDSTQDLLCYQDCAGSISVTVTQGTTPYSYEWYDANTGNPISPQQDTSEPQNLCAGDYYVEVTDANGCQESSSTFTLTQPDSLSHDTSSTDVLCAGDCNGSATLDTVHGGTPPYSYEWYDGSGTSIGQTDSTATALCAGDYYAVITDDNGCQLESDTMTVTEPPALSLDTSKQDILCNSNCTGEASVSVSGGTAPYSFEWYDDTTDSPIGISNDTASGLCEGDYYAIVTDANNCIDTSVVITIDEPSELTTSVSASDVTCNGDCDGEMSVDVNGGVTPYSIDWYDASSGNPIGQTGDTASGLCPGDYFAIVEDGNACKDTTDTLNISQPAPLSVSLNVDHISCGGACDGSITANPSGGNGNYSYQWYESSTGNPLGTSQTQNNLCPGDYYVEVTDDEGCTITSVDSTVTEPPPLSMSTSSEQASCNDSCDGMAIADVSGGTPPYTYNWTDGGGNPIPVNDDTLTGLCDGTYNITVTDDNGCSVGPQNINVSEPAPLDTNLTLQDASCDGTCDGEASLSMSGGTSPYSYSWSTGGSGSSETGICAGSHSVTITDANGCDTTVGFSIDDPPALSISVSTEDVSCNGDCDGAGVVTVSGGSPPYDFQWLDGSGNPIPGETDSTITGLCPGNYGVEVEDDSGCGTSNTSLSIDEPAPISSNLNVDDVTCNGDCDGSITANVSGGNSPYSYQWYDNSGFPLSTGSSINNLCPGDYYVEITDDEGCTHTSNTVTVSQPPALSLTTSGTDISCYGQCDGEVVANVTGGTSPYTYDWSNSSGTTIGTNDTVSNLCEDNYTVNVVDDNGCTIGPQSVSVDEPDSLEATLSKTDASCNGNCDGSAVLVVNGGTLPYSYNWSTGTTDSTESGLCAGSYNVNVSDANGCDTTIQFTIDEPASLSLSTTATDPTCQGQCDGSGSVSISGGTTPYDIQWYDDAWNPIPGDTNTTVSGYCEGTYYVEVVDSNGCTENDSIVLNAPQPLNLTIDSTNDASCGTVCDGSIGISVSGGSTPYSYDWIDATTGTSTGITTEDPDSLCSGNYFVEVSDDNGCTISSDTVTINEDVVITGTSDHEDASCFGYCDGSAWVSPSGGTAPYDYTWINTGTGDTIGTTDSISGLCADTFAVTITDDIGCSSAPIIVTVDEASLLTLETDSVPVSCSGGSDGKAIVTPSGGTAPYSYQWDASTGNQTDSAADNLSAGTYSVTVTDTQGCSTDTSVSVTEPSPVSANLDRSNASCNGDCDGMAWVAPSGGTAPYSIQWYDSGGNAIPGATNDTLDTLCAGSYSVAVTDNNGCVDSVAFTIGEPAPLNVGIGSSSDLSCNGSDDGSATATASGGSSPYNYQWDDPSNQSSATASGLSPGSYTVTVTDDNGCIDSAQVTISEPTPLDFDTSMTDVSCNGDCDGSATVTSISGGTSPYSIQWNDPLGQSGSTAVSLCAGTYEVTITDANGCDTSGTLSIDEPTAIDIAVDTVVDPSCAGGCDGNIGISTSGGSSPYSYAWIDISNGDTVSTMEDPSGLCAGSYQVNVTDANGCKKDTTIDLTDPPAMTASFDTVNASCGNCDGEAMIAVSNGTPPYSYSWSPAPGGGAGTDSIYDLCPDVYSVQVTDADGCTQTFSISISNIGAEETDSDSTLVSCDGTCDGSASVTLVGGCSDPSCSIAWLDSTGSSIGQSGNTASGLCEGLYYAEVTNGSGCISLEPVEINSPGAIQPNLSSSDASCGGACDGEASVSPNGGTPPYSYSWSSGTTPNDSMTGGLCAGSHSVTISDANGCDTTVDFSIDEPPLLSIDDKDSSMVSCNGGTDGSATVFPTGGNPGYAYEWYDCNTGSPIGQTTQQATNLSAGSYYAVVTDNNGCTTTSSCISVDEPAPLDAIPSVIQHITCNGSDNGIAEVDGSGGTSPYSFEWRDDNGNVIASGTDTVYNLAPATYAVEVTDLNGCQAVDSISIDEPAPLSVSSSTQPVTCNGGCDGEIQSSVSGGSIPYSYQWYDDNGNPLPGDTNATLVDCAGIYTLKVTDGNGCNISLTDTIEEPPALALSISTNPVSCNGDCDGSASVSVSGGNGGPYSYQWLDSLENPIAGETSSTLNNACAGTYYAVVSDQKGCADTIQGTIDGKDSLLATTSSNNSTCGDCNGSATVNPSGGSGPYSYQWDANAGNQTTQTATGLCAGVYSVTVTDANGCSKTFSASVSDDGAEVVTTDSLDESCFDACDGEAIVDYSCSSTPCSVDWYDASTGNSIGQTGDTATGLCQGDYYAEVTNGNGCVTVKTVTVEGPDPIEANETVNDPTCSGGCDGSISLSTSGGTSPYTYSWTDSSGTVIGNSNSISGLCAGPYTVSITDDNGCDTTYTFDVNDPSPLNATMDSSNVACNGDCNGTALVTPSGGTTPYAYQWYDGGSAIPGATDSTISGLCAGAYSVELTDANGCDTTLDVQIEEPAPIQPDLSKEDILCNGDCNGSASVDPTGGSGAYAYQWYDSSGVAIPSETDSMIDNRCPGKLLISIMDSNGCSVTDSTTIVEPAPLTLSIDSISHPSCNGTCDGMISVTASGGSGSPSNFSYQWYDGGGNPLPSSDTTFKDDLCGGGYTIEVTDTNACTSTRDTLLVEPASITADLSSTDADCGVNNGSVSVSNVNGGSGGYSYQWFDNGMNPIGSGTSVSSLGSGLYNLEITDGSGCTASFSVTIDNVNAPVISTDSIDPVLCSGGQSGAIYVSVSGGDAPYDHLWNPGGYISQDLIDAEAGIYLLEVTDSNGCTRYHEDTIPGATPMTASFNSSNATCGDCDGEAIVSVNGGASPYSYQWSTGSTNDSATGLCAGVHSVEITDSLGCQQSFDVTISDNGGPTIDNIVEDPVTCYGDCDGSASVSVSGGVPPYDYYWPHDGSDSSGQANLCAGTYHVQVEDSLGCLTTATINIDEPAPLSDSANIYPSACGVCDGIIDLHIDGGTPPYNYSWSNGMSSSTITGLCQGIYSVTVQDNNGCSQSFSYSVQGSNAPQVSADPKDVSCGGTCDGEAYATVASATDIVFEWYDASGTSIGQNSDTATNLCPGQYTVEVEDTSTGCQGYATVEIESPDSLSFNLPNTKDISCYGSCDGEATVSFTGGTAPYSVQWDPSGDNGLQATGLCAGTQTVQVTDDNGCVDSQEVNISQPGPISINVDSVQQPDCNSSGDGAIWTSVAGGSSPYSYDWSGPSGFTANTQDIDSLDAGTYTVELTDDQGCSIMDTVQLDPSVPVNANGAPDTSVCQGDSLLLIGSGGVTNSEWLDASGATVSTNDSLTVDAPSAGSYYYVAYNASCSDTDTVDIGVDPIPNADAGDDATIIVNEEHELGGSPTGPAGSTFDWVPMDWFTQDSSSSSPLIQPEEPGSYTYTVTVTSPAGCTARDSLTIEVKPDLVFPDGFSPNGDGVNDVWEIDRIEEFPEATVGVYNRWGERLFYSEGYEEPWDGTYNGEPVPVGTYYYVIDLNDPEAVKQKYTGPITIVR